jgi:hypothetical protein
VEVGIRTLLLSLNISIKRGKLWNCCKQINKFIHQ